MTETAPKVTACWTSCLASRLKSATREGKASRACTEPGVRMQKQGPGALQCCQLRPPGVLHLSALAARAAV